MTLKRKLLALVMSFLMVVPGLGEDLSLPEETVTPEGQTESEVNMPSIPQINVGGTVYDLHDKRVDHKLMYLEDYRVVNSFDDFTIPIYRDMSGQEHDGGGVWFTTPLEPTCGYKAMSFCVYHYVSGPTEVASIAFFDSEKQFIGAIRNINVQSSGQGAYTGQCAIPDDAAYWSAVCNKNVEGYTPYVILHKDSSEVDLTNIISTYNTVYTREGGLATYNGWFRSDFIPVHGFKSVSFVAGGFHSGDVQLESVTFFGNGGVRIGGVFANISDNNPRLAVGSAVIPREAKYLAITYDSSKSVPHRVILHNPDAEPVGVVCIGDSITEGYMGTGVVDPENSYPTMMQEVLGNKYAVLNAGVGGSHAMTWFNRWKEYLNIQNYNTQVVIIMLGTNGGLEDVFATDVDPFDDYHNYSESITGKTCALIEWLQEQAPNALIVIATPLFVDGGKAPGNARAADSQCEYINEIIKRYHIPLIDTRNITGVNNKNSDHWLVPDGVHGTAICYKRLGTVLANQLRALI